MFAAAQVKEETIDDPSPPAQELTDAERTALQLQQCSSARCIEEMCKLQEEALAEGRSRRKFDRHRPVGGGQQRTQAAFQVCAIRYMGLQV